MKINTEPFHWLPTALRSSSFQTDALEAVAFYGFSVQVNFTNSTPDFSGEMTLESSIEPKDPTPPVHWVTVLGSEKTLDDTLESHIWNYTTIYPIECLRVNVEITSGSSEIEIIFQGIRV